jgi:ADP-heptose:LPS heptosyltransferase
MLREAGARLVFFHSWKCARPGRDEVRPHEIGAYPALRLPWPELAATIAACELVISVDTGIFHLAGALSVPTLGLFGPTSGEVMCRPYPTHSPVTSPERPPGCDPPCYGRPERGYSKDVCGRVGCEVLRGVTPEAALRRVTEWQTDTTEPAEGG